jgi:hypothetical protein
MRIGIGIVAITLGWSLFPTLGLADVIIGYVSFDNLIPGSPVSPGVNGFTIGHLTGDPSSGGNDLPPDFPVFTSITFLNSSLQWFSGSSSQSVSLGDLGPGFFNPVALQFPDSATFTSALFTATLDTTAFELDPLVGGGTFTASSDQISVLLQPSSGQSLVAGTDFALIDVSNQLTPVPELNSGVLLGSLLIAVWLVRRFCSSKDQQSKQL